MRTLKKIVFILLIVFFTRCTPEIQQDQFAGTTWEMVSAEYIHPDTIFRNPTSEFQKAMTIYGQSHLIAVWQDTSFQESFFVTHEYSVEGDTLVLFPKMFWDPAIIGQTIKLKYQFNGDQLILDGALPDVNLIHEVWRRVD